jgi:hypothetical protein
MGKRHSAYNTLGIRQFTAHVQTKNPSLYIKRRAFSFTSIFAHVKCMAYL